jgi:predicted transcriptional regulator
MPRPPSSTLTDGELRLMNVLWRNGPSTVLETQHALTDDLVDSTIRTLLQILESKRYVRRRKEGRAYRYHAAVAQGESRSTVIDSVVQKFFGSPADLVLNLIDSEELDDAELANIRRAIDRRRRTKDK